MNSVWKKRIFFLLPVLVLLAGALLFLRGQKPEPIYFRTAAFGRLTERLEGDPFTVYRWDGGETYTPVFTAEEAEEVWAEASAGVGTVRFPCLLTWAKGGFLLNEADWWAQDPAEANVYSFYTWSGKRTELRQAERR